MDANTLLINAWLARPGIDKSAPIHPEFVAGFDAALAQIAKRGAQVSMDVSTGDTDAGNRIFGTIDVVQDGVILAIEDSRNF